MQIRSVLILGATGRTGHLLVERALACGLDVTVLVRDPSKVKSLQNHPSIEILNGDVLCYPDIFNAVQGNDAVLSALTHDGRNVDVLTKGASNIVRAITQSRVKKFVCLSSLGAGSTKPLAGWMMKVVIFFVGRSLSIEAKGDQELMLYQSSIDFTLVMASPLTSNTDSHRDLLSFLPTQAPCLWKTPPKVSRALVAAFMVDQLASQRWHRQTVCIIGQ
jgi:uncharacterized protein YbjT (DUF2867 family)